MKEAWCTLRVDIRGFFSSAGRPTDAEGYPGKAWIGMFVNNFISTVLSPVSKRQIDFNNS
jgi:hypothetical protein